MINPYDIKKVVSSVVELTTESTYQDANGKSYANVGLVVAVDNTTNSDENGIYFLKDTDVTSIVNWQKANEGSGGGGSVVVVQSTGTSTTDVMSQKAVTDSLNNKANIESGKGLSTNDYTNADKTIVENVSTNLDTKVDKVSGKGLSTNDYTAVDKAKVDAIPQVVQVTGTSTTDVMSQKTVTDLLNTKVTIEADKGLSSNDYTDEDKLSVNNVGKIFDTTSNIPIYVSVTGSDETGDGSQENPYLTIQHAVDTIPKVLNYVVRLIIGGGTYTENVLISSITGAGQLYIIGSSSSRATLSGSLIMVTSNLSRVDIRNLTISSEATKVLEFYCVSASEIKVSDCLLTRLNSNQGTNALDVNLSSLVIISDCELNSTRYGVQVSSGKLLIDNAVTINSTDENLHLYYGGQIILMHNSPGDFTFDKSTGAQLIAPNGTITI